MILAIAQVSYENTKSLVATENWVLHTQEVISKALFLEKLMIDMETGERGFLITGKESYLGQL